MIQFRKQRNISGGIAIAIPSTIAMRDLIALFRKMTTNRIAGGSDPSDNSD